MRAPRCASPGPRLWDPPRPCMSSRTIHQTNACAVGLVRESIGAEVARDSATRGADSYVSLARLKSSQQRGERAVNGVARGGEEPDVVGKVVAEVDGAAVLPPTDRAIFWVGERWDVDGEPSVGPTVQVDVGAVARRARAENIAAGEPVAGRDSAYRADWSR